MGNYPIGEPDEIEQSADSEPDTIPVGAYHDGRYVQSGRYDPERDEVRVSARGGPDSTIWVDPDEWIEMFAIRHAINTRAETAYQLFRDGDLREQPQCGDCGAYVHPLWVQRSQDVSQAVTDEILCKSHLKQRYNEAHDPLWLIYPWENLEDIRDHVLEMGVESFDDPGGVLDPLR